MTALEVLATILAVAILVKLVVVVINPQAWMTFVEKIVKNTLLLTIIYLTLAIIVGYFIFSNLSIVEVAAVLLFAALLIAIGMLPYMPQLLTMAQEALNEGALLRKFWLPIVIWLIIAVWALYGVFA